jgi:Protein of unknown function (DUF3108)
VTQRLKPAVVFTSLILLILLFSPVSAQRKGDAVLPFSPAPYRVGERLTYNVSFSNFISAAHVELRVVARGNFFGRDAIQLRAHVETSGLVNAALFAINNDYTTYVDPETGFPFRAENILREGARTSDSMRDFNQNVLDYVSAVYRLRALPLTDGASYSLTIIGDKQEYQTDFKILGRQTVKTSAGSFNAIVGQFRVKNDSQANGRNLRVYFGDDERHIPVLFTAKHSAGEIRAELAGSDFVIPKTTAPTPAPAATQRPVQSPTVVPPSSAAGDLNGLPFKVGEQLNYQVYLGNVPQVAATASFQIRSRSRYFDRDGLLVTVKAQTTNAIQRLFFANDEISSYMDPRALLPFRTELNLVEGRRRSNHILTLSQDYGTATTQTGEKIDIPVGTHDLLSVFYAARTFNLAPPKRNAVSLLVNNEVKTLFISALARESIRMGEQDIPAIQVSLTTDDPQPDKFQLRAWISDDNRRLPLRLTAVTQIGLVRADLAIIPVVPQ